MKKAVIGFSLLALLGAVSTGALAAEKAKADDVPKLIITDIKVGTGAEAIAEKKLTVHYTGWVYDAKAKDHKGVKVQSSHDAQKPYKFDLARRQAIDGWDEGLVGMKVGGVRNLIIPSKMGYGASGAGGIVPPNAALVFDVELLKVE
ncbi:MAG: FKBP-type peptidyl-prolyl cis-trans isomerase [Gallionellaceae bacterium]|jgi:FKBP-type peptidyl-prolyl cis-trans isomerase|nr:FKBP-type peptidyl-prolyl cis-trans isomerase [Gallionellaceae bacterium]